MKVKFRRMWKILESSLDSWIQVRCIAMRVKRVPFGSSTPFEIEIPYIFFKNDLQFFINFYKKCFKNTFGALGQLLCYDTSLRYPHFSILLIFFPFRNSFKFKNLKKISNFSFLIYEKCI